MERDYFKMILFTLLWFVAAFFVICFCSCQSVKYVPYEVVKMDSIYNTIYQKETVYKQDSIIIKEKGDTVTIEKVRYLFMDKEVHDTLYIERTDTITNVVEVERGLTTWQRLKLDMGGMLIGGVLIMLIFFVGKRLF